jgi:hypothetical protein
LREGRLSWRGSPPTFPGSGPAVSVSGMETSAVPRRRKLRVVVKTGFPPPNPYAWVMVDDHRGQEVFRSPRRFRTLSLAWEDGGKLHRLRPSNANPHRHCQPGNRASEPSDPMHDIARQFHSRVTMRSASVYFSNENCTIKTAWGDWISARWVRFGGEDQQDQGPRCCQ